MTAVSSPRLLALYALLAALLVVAPLQAEEHSTAFYYTTEVPLPEAALYSRIVVQADQTRDFEISWLRERGVEVFAYLSVGESSAMSADVDILARNEIWNTSVPDLADPDWQKDVGRRASQRLERFDGLFLDTLDSFHLAGAERYESQRDALVKIIDDLSQQAAGKLILNRGFDVMERLQSKALMVVAEGLFTRFSPGDESYRRGTSVEDQNWLLARLSEARALGFTTQVLDYAETQADREAVAKEIIDAGHLPWVADGHLTTWGTGSLIPVPRRVVALYRAEDEYEDGIPRQEFHKRLEAFIEYLGYVVDHHNTADGPPPHLDPALHAGVVVWTLDDSLYTESVTSWLKSQLGKAPVLLMGSMPEDPALLSAFGIRLAGENAQGFLVIETLPPEVAGESRINLADLTQVVSTKRSRTPAEILFALRDGRGEVMPQFTVNENGGAALAPWIVKVFPDSSHQWQLNPLTLLRRSLKLPDIPRVDVTTETGKRILVTHIDGDGMPSTSWFPHKKRTGQVIHDEILDRYGVPTTVSIIEAELAPHGLFPEISAELEADARKIFAREDVEMASHTFSHPFFWPDANGVLHISEEDTRYGFHLPVPDYQLDPKREIIGSIDYINRELAPPGKQVEVMLWSGEALVAEPSLAATEQAGVLAMNGGNTHSSPTTRSTSEIWPIGRHLSKRRFQIYAPVMNENVYTNDWEAPYAGYRNVLDTFRLTDAPRLKPFNIYYHFYSGAYPASLNALRTVYETVLSTQPTALFASEYIEHARAFYDAAIARTHKGAWHITNGAAPTIRTPASWPEPAISDSVAGYALINDQRYLHTPSNRTVLTSSPLSERPFVRSANAIIDDWKTAASSTRFQLRGHMPFTVELARTPGCTLTLSNALDETSSFVEPQSVNLSAGMYRGTLDCRSLAARE